MVLPSHRRARNASIVLGMIVLLHCAPTARAQIFDYSIEDPGSHGGLGSAVCRLGDIDFDGAEDFAVSAPFTTGSGVAGTGIVFFESGATGINISTLSGTPGCNLGASIDGHIDVDGDGYLDVLIGAPLDSSLGISEAGAIYVFSPHLGTIPVFWYGGTPKGHFGSSTRTLAADIDGDGLDDFIVGEPGNDSSYVFYAKGTLYFANSGQSGSHFGTSVCRGGDLSGDGVCDYLAGSPDYVDSSSTTTGRIDAFSGKDGSKLWSVNGAADSKYGKSLAEPGDLDGDGIADVVVGAPQHLDSGGNQTGCAIVLSGATQNVIYKAFGDNDNDTFGHELHAVGGDIDNDGANDFIVGAPQLLGSNVGYARTISGATGKTLFTYTEHTSDPYSMSDYGVAVCGGDFNNDGRTDVLIGGNNFVAGDGIAETWITAVARWNNYGKGWAGSNGVPALIPLSDPVVGQLLNLGLDNSLGASTAGLLVLGLSKDSIPTGKGGTLLVDPFLFEALSIPAGGLTLSGKVPDDPSLYGFDLYLQAIEADSGASKGLSFTRGLDLIFGF
jgi:FG-GAP repeat protein/VCBS repeat protein